MKKSMTIFIALLGLNFSANATDLNQENGYTACFEEAMKSAQLSVIAISPEYDEQINWFCTAHPSKREAQAYNACMVKNIADRKEKFTIHRGANEMETMYEMRRVKGLFYIHADLCGAKSYKYYLQE